jgi:[ribosomal protein S5]-alanine N-acetyltransferase
MTAAFPEQIETTRLRFRPPVLQDAEVIFAAYAQDPAVTRFLVWSPHGSIEVTRKFIATCIVSWQNATAFPYVLTNRTSGQILGMLEVRPAGHRANIGYVLAQAHWGQGVMSEAVSAVTELALSTLSLFRVDATCDVENKASVRVLEKSGFIKEGRLARYLVHPNISPEPRDNFMYAAVR